MSQNIFTLQIETVYMEDTPPNLLFIVLDSVRADHTSIHNCGRQTTPFLETLSEDAYVFKNAFAAAPWTPPSHASMFLGSYPSRHGYFEGGDSLNSTHPTLAETLSAEEYRTFGAVRNWHIDSQKEVTQGFQEFEDIYRLPEFPGSISEFKQKYIDLFPGYLKIASKMLNTSRKPSDYISCEYIKQRMSDGDDPFFGFINIAAPHSPYLPPEPYRSQFESFDKESTDMDLVRLLSCVDGNGWQKFTAGKIDSQEGEEVWSAVKDWYAGEIRFSDLLVEQLVERLHNLGVYNNTMIIVTSDHGEHFGEHDRASHQFSLFDELLHVPLLIKPPNTTEHNFTSTERLVSLVDLFPTILSEFDLPVPESVDGIDIFSSYKRKKIFAEYKLPAMVKSGLQESVPEIDKEIRQDLFRSLQCVRTNQHKLIKSDEGPDRFYEVGEESPKDRLTADIDRQSLQSMITDTLDDEFSDTHHKSLDSKSRENLEGLGYI